MLYYMLSANSQNILGVRELEGIPMNRTMYEVFQDVYQADLGMVDEQIQKASAGGSQWLADNKKYMESWK